jgi:hypothetical protein
VGILQSEYKQKGCDLGNRNFCGAQRVVQSLRRLSKFVDTLRRRSVGLRSEGLPCPLPLWCAPLASTPGLMQIFKDDVMHVAMRLGCRSMVQVALAAVILNWGGGGALAQPYNSGQTPYTNWITTL